MTEIGFWECMIVAWGLGSGFGVGFTWQLMPLQTESGDTGRKAKNEHRNNPDGTYFLACRFS